MRTVSIDNRTSAVARKVANDRAPKPIPSGRVADGEKIKSYQRALRMGMIMTKDVPAKYRPYM